MNEPIFLVRDQACVGKALRMRLVADACGVTITALDDQERPMGSVTLDYFDNRLSAVVYMADDDEEPSFVHVLTDDVKTRRSADQQTGASHAQE